MKRDTARAIGQRLRRDAREILRTALEVCSPERIISSALVRTGDVVSGPGFQLELKRREKILILSYGKASGAMTRAFSEVLPRDCRLGGLAVLPESGEPAPGLRNLRSSHPIPDRRSFLAGRTLLAAIARLHPGDRVVHLISGGGSALLASPLAPLVTPREKSLLHKLVVASDLGILEINMVRKHFSAVKGGRLALRAPTARHLSLILSDVPSARPEAVAGGPTLADPSRWGDCLAVLRESGILSELPSSLKARLDRSDLPETPAPWDSRFRGNAWAVLGSGESLVEAAASRARELGYRVRVLRPSIEEPAEGALDRFLLEWGRLRAGGGMPLCVVGGGEVRVKSQDKKGRGGRAQDLAAAAALRLHGSKGCLLLAAGSDGLDGNSPAAGAVVDGKTLVRARREGLSPAALRGSGDTYRLFRKLGDSLRVGPTGNNLRDLYLLLTGPGKEDGPRATSEDRRGS